MLTPVVSRSLVEPAKSPATRPKRQSRAFFDHYFLRLFILDWILVNLVLLICLGVEYPIADILLGNLSHAIALLVVSNLLWLAVTTITDRYWLNEEGRKAFNYKSLLIMSVVYFGLLSIIYNEFFFLDLQVQFLFPSFILFITISTLLYFTIQARSRPGASFFTYAVVGGDEDHVKNISQVIQTMYGYDNLCLGRFGHGPAGLVNKLGTYDRVYDFVRTGSIDKLFYIDGSLNKTALHKLIRESRNNLVDLEVVPAAMYSFKQGVSIDHLGILPIFSRKKEPLRYARNRLLKRLLDISFSLIFLIVIFPWMFVIIAILIKLDSKGPIFFRQRRTGYWNRPFDMIKFRTMRKNLNADKIQAIPGDRRVTKIGRFLRKTSLDEIPQFINVLKGEMSVVGPRPHMLKHTEDYGRMIEWYLVRHEVKPGITGWAQVNGLRGPTEKLQQMLKRVEFDVHYIEHWTFWLDLICIGRTIVNTFKDDRNAL